MSGAQVSSSMPLNELYNMTTGATGLSLQSSQNELMKQQQDISGHQIEMGARLASTLLDPALYPTTEARAAAYPGLVARARAQFPGYFTNAPDTYPGDAATQALARLGTPSADLFKYGIDRTAKGAIAPGDGTTATGGTGTGGGGGGTGTVGGADTAPINAAGDSRTRKAGEGGPPAAGSPGAAVAQQVHDFWISKGFSEPVVAGIMAGGPGSESDFTPTAGGDKVNGVATSYGLYQHHGERLANMQRFFGLSSGQMPSADQQNQYAHWEITQGPLKNVGVMLNNAKTAAEASAIWTQYFGVPADKTEIGRRAAGAQRFVGLYGRPQQGGPGGATAPAVVTGDVARPGDVPPPPGGTPGTYGGGGFGAVVGGQPAAVRATVPAGRPTGPPVVTDQPAGSNVVAGPPGTAVVGAPQPPSPEVPGNVAAINAGIVARGGQPVTDPNATPTPARYAGTAPAPSVEAAPEAGWGTGIGSGYGPQNTLAPPAVQPPPARPAAPAAAQPAAQQPPAADTLPPLPAPTPPAPTNRNGLTPFQQQDIDRRRNMPTVSADELQKRVDSYVATNAAVAEKYQQDQIAYVREMRERQTTAGAAAHQTLEEQRQAEADKRAVAEAVRQQAKFDQEMVASNRPYPGNSPEAADNNILIAGSQPGGDTSSPTYANAYARQKYKEASNGNVIARDMSMFKPPTKPDTAPTVTPGPTAIFERENTLRDEFQKLTADFRVVQNSYENLAKTAEKPSGAGDMSLLYSYVRLLDPTSVVRESEFATAAASGSFGERIQGAVGRLMSGERLPDSLRQDFVREARNLYDTQLRNHNQMADTYTRIAKQSGVDPDKVVTRFDRPQTPPGLKVIIP